ncbi:MAG TPA: hypothetical protein VGC91_16885 [Pyrinomonadaceae bacterium]
MSESSWRKLVFPFTSNEATQVGWGIVHLAEARHKELGSPANFAIFHSTEFSEDGRESFAVFYFSPVAAASFADILARYSAIPCDAPVPHEMFGIAFGDLHGSESWDLLK